MVVEEAPDGETAFAAIAAVRPDVAVLDAMMPGIDGWEVERRVAPTRRRPILPLIFLTAVDRGDAEARAAELGGLFVAKPFSPWSCARQCGAALSG